MPVSPGHATEVRWSVKRHMLFPANTYLLRITIRGNRYQQKRSERRAEDNLGFGELVPGDRPEAFGELSTDGRKAANCDRKDTTRGRLLGVSPQVQL